MVFMIGVHVVGGDVLEDHVDGDLEVGAADVAVDLEGPDTHGDMCHAGDCRCTMPVLFAGGKPDDITGSDFLDWPAPALRPAAAGRHYQSLAERMRVPSGSGTWLERDAYGQSPRGVRRVEQR